MFPAKQECNIIFLFHSAPYEALKILDKTCFNPTTSAVLLTVERPELVAFSSHQHHISAQLQTSKPYFLQQQSTRASSSEI
jgi:hypothetical protein